MNESDIEALRMRDFVDRSISEKDPYIQATSKSPEFKFMHPAVQRTEDMLDKLSMH